MLWKYPNQASFYFGGKPAVDFYNLKITERREQAPVQEKANFKTQLDLLNKNGFAKWDQVVSHDVIDSMNDKVSFLIKNKKNLKSD